MRALPPLVSFASPLDGVEAGTVLLRRGQTPEHVLYVEAGSVALGLLGPSETGVMEHQLGLLQAPAWLEAHAAVLHVPYALDAVALSALRVRRMPVEQFRTALAQCAESAHSVLTDVARAHYQQTELAVSRLAKDADARCAEWLLRHAQPAEQGTHCVHLQQRKRLIAQQLGIAPETLSRVLRHLRERKLISGSGSVVQLVDMTGLRVLAGA